MVQSLLTSFLKNNDYPLGRWSTIEIGHSKKKIFICNAYIVGPSPISHARNNTAAYQQWILLSKKNCDIHPRKKAINDLIDLIKNKIEKSYEIILMLDANDTIKTHKGIISKLQHTCHLQAVQ